MANNEEKRALELARELHKLSCGAFKEDLEHYFPELRESEDERIRKALVWHLKAGEDFVSNGVTKEECIAYLEKQKEQKSVECKNGLTNFENSINQLLADKCEIYYNENLGGCYDLKGLCNTILKLAYNELRSELEKDFFEAKQEGRQEGYEAGVYDTEQKVKPAEWSEEDEIKLEDVINDLETLKGWIRKHDTGWKNNPGLTLIDKRISWLKSLRPNQSKKKVI